MASVATQGVTLCLAGGVLTAFTLVGIAVATSTQDAIDDMQAVITPSAPPAPPSDPPAPPTPPPPSPPSPSPPPPSPSPPARRKLLSKSERR